MDTLKLVLSFFNSDSNKFEKIKADKDNLSLQEQVNQFNKADSIAIFCKNHAEMIEAEATLKEIEETSQLEDSPFNAFNGGINTSQTSMRVSLMRNPTRSFTLSDFRACATDSASIS